MVLQKREYTAHLFRILSISWQKVYSTGLSLSLSLVARTHKSMSTHVQANTRFHIHAHILASHTHTNAESQKHIHMHDAYADTSIQAQVHACTNILALIHILLFLWCNGFRLILEFFFFNYFYLFIYFYSCFQVS
jgi:hypothetical protein